MPKLRCLFSLLFCLLLTGCFPLAFIGGAAAGVGGYKYYQGAMIVIYQAPYEKTWDASIEALEDMGYNVESKRSDITSGKISTKEGNDTKQVKLSLKYVSAQETEVTIRVGLLGDENASNVIKDKIGRMLFK